VAGLVGGYSGQGHLFDFFMNPGRDGILNNFEVIIHLKAQPERGRISEINRQSQSGVSRYAAFAMNNFIDSTGGNAQGAPKLILAYLHGRKELFKENLTRMYRFDIFHVLSSVIIYNLDISGMTVHPFEADPPLLIDSDAMLPLSLA